MQGKAKGLLLLAVVLGGAGILTALLRPASGPTCPKVLGAMR